MLAIAKLIIVIISARRSLARHRKVEYFVAPMLQWPVDEHGESKKHFIVPAWYVTMLKEDEDHHKANMSIQWESCEVGGLHVSVPILVNTRAVKRGEALKRPHMDHAPTPPKRQRTA